MNIARVLLPSRFVCRFCRVILCSVDFGEPCSQNSAVQLQSSPTGIESQAAEHVELSAGISGISTNATSSITTRLKIHPDDRKLLVIRCRSVAELSLCWL